MSCKEVRTFWLDMGAPISLLSRGSCDCRCRVACRVNPPARRHPIAVSLPGQRPPTRGRPMRAVILTTEGQPAAVGDAPEPVAPPDGAVVELRASSVNGFDVFQASGAIMAMMPHDLPTIVGRDLAGVVTA